MTIYQVSLAIMIGVAILDVLAFILTVAVVWAILLWREEQR